MDPSKLSSNWKKLQQTLEKSENKKEQGKVVGANGDSQHKALKRKLDSHTAGVSAAPKRQKVSSFRKATGAKMGAYISSGRANGQEVSAENLTDDTAEQKAVDTKGEVNIAVAGKYIALDCEMVGTNEPTPFSVLAHNKDTKPGAPPEYSVLARASLVNYNGETVYDMHVLPPAGVQVSNYRTPWSGITAADLEPGNPTTNPITFEKAQNDVFALLQGRILVGHAVLNDLEILGLTHPKRDVRDTSRYPKYRELTALIGKNGKPGKGRTPSLKKLASEVLGVDIHMGKGHSSVEDAWTSMLLFKREKNGFEMEVTKLYGRAPGRTAVLKAANVNKASAAPKAVKTVDAASDSEEEAEDDIDEVEALDEELEGEESEDSESTSRSKSNSKPKKKKKKKKAKSRTKR